MTTRPIFRPSARVSEVVPVDVCRAARAVSLAVVTGGGVEDARGDDSASTTGGGPAAGIFAGGRGAASGLMDGGTGAGGSETGAGVAAAVVTVAGIAGAVRNSMISRLGLDNCEVVA